MFLSSPSVLICCVQMERGYKWITHLWRIQIMHHVQILDFMHKAHVHNLLHRVKVKLYYLPSQLDWITLPYIFLSHLLFTIKHLCEGCDLSYLIYSIYLFVSHNLSPE